MSCDKSGKIRNATANFSQWYCGFSIPVSEHGNREGFCLVIQCVGALSCAEYNPRVQFELPCRYFCCMPQVGDGGTVAAFYLHGVDFSILYQQEIDFGSAFGIPEEIELRPLAVVVETAQQLAVDPSLENRTSKGAVHEGLRALPACQPRA